MDNIEQQLSQISNFCYIHPHLLTSSQPNAEQLAQIKAYGVDTIINLGLSDEQQALTYEDRHCLSLGLNYIHIPIDWDCPRDEQCLLVLDLIHALVQDKIVWLHCGDYRRVSCLIYLYQQFAMQVDIVNAEHYLHHTWQPNETWTGLIHAVTLQLQGRKATQELQQSLQQADLTEQDDSPLSC